LRRRLLILLTAALLSNCASVSHKQSPSDKMYYDAYIYLYNNDYANSIELLSDLIAMDQAYTQAYVLRAYAFEQEDLLDTARQDLLSAESIDPNNHVIHYNLGNVYFRLKDYEKAVDQYTISISMNRKHQFSYLNRASVYMTLHKWKEALADYKVYVTLSDDQKDSILKVISILEKRE
jgi:tetratricopeptide (TPR) repeat protein